MEDLTVPARVGKAEGGRVGEGVGVSEAGGVARE